MQEKPQINTWILKDKELLEKLSIEISRDFSISEKLAKKLIFETHLSLEDLKKDIDDENNNLETKVDFDKEKLDRLLIVLKWAKELIEKASKKEIEELKEVLEKADIWEINEILEKLFSKDLIKKAQNPQNISEEIMWASLWILNSWILITDILYNLWKWIITSIPDFISIISWRWELEGLKKV